MAAADLDTLRARVAGHANWYHRIKLAPGLVTPGVHDSQSALRMLDGLGLPPDCGGLRVLDVGCRDGFFAFELERRGATVVGLDYADPKVTGFSIAAEILGSQVEYLVDNVYDLSPERHGLFDLVLFLGVLYHVRNPILALDCLRSVTKPGALVFVETQICSEAAVGSLELPLWQFFPRDSLYGDATNKWAPNLAGLTSALEECQFEILEVVRGGDRAAVRARGITDNRLEYFRRVDAGTRMWGQGGRPVD
jgi:tRNA (mo5U34)-methyltransferase